MKHIEQTTVLSWEDIEVRVTYDYWPEIRARVLDPPVTSYAPESAEVYIKLISVRPYGYKLWLHTFMPDWNGPQLKAIHNAILEPAQNQWEENDASAEGKA